MPDAGSTWFAAPRWLRDLCRTSWLLLGFALLVAGFVWLLPSPIPALKELPEADL